MRRLLVAALALLATAGLGCGDSDEATAKVAPSFYGVAPQSAVSEADLARMGSGNVGSYHVLLSWARIETNEGFYDWTVYDDLLGELAVQGIEPVAYVFGTPPWLARSGVVPPGPLAGGPRRLRRVPHRRRRALRPQRDLLGHLRPHQSRCRAGADPHLGDLERDQQPQLLEAATGSGRVREALPPLVEDAAPRRPRGRR